MVRESLRAGLCLPQSLELPEAKVVSHPIKPGPPKNRRCLFHESKVPQELGCASSISLGPSETWAVPLLSV